MLSQYDKTPHGCTFIRKSLDSLFLILFSWQSEESFLYPQTTKFHSEGENLGYVSIFWCSSKVIILVVQSNPWCDFIAGKCNLDLLNFNFDRFIVLEILSNFLLFYSAYFPLSKLPILASLNAKPENFLVCPTYQNWGTYRQRLVKNGKYWRTLYLFTTCNLLLLQNYSNTECFRK